MSDDEMFQKALLGMTVASLMSTVVTLLKELSKYHDNRSGPWFDELQEKSIRNIKTTTSQGISLETELKAMNSAIAIIKQTFDDADSSMLPP